MITISLCMIVRNEEAVLDRCLSTVADLMDEIIIVDTGSTDGTKEIAKKYTNQVYDFEWCDDFSAARNCAFSKATMEYIYAPDADEMLDEENRRRFLLLKQCMVPEVEIVQMHYITRSEYNTTQNFKNELRPKLFRRLREFTWIDPVHETVRLDPVVFDSDVEILHLPQASHGKRDFAIFEKNLAKGNISDRLGFMYAKELYKCGDLGDIHNALPYFEGKRTDSNLEVEANIIWARYLRLSEDATRFQQDIISNMELFEYSEICCEIGMYCEAIDNPEVAAEWYARAMGAPAVINIESTGPIPLMGLARCCRIQGRFDEAQGFELQAKEWELPEEFE